MNKHVFRSIVVITFIISVSSFVLGYFYPSDLIASFYQFYYANHTGDPSSILLNSLSYTSLLFLIVSVVGMIMFWAPSRILFVISYIIILPHYFIEPPLIYSPLSKILYDIGMIGSGVILAIMYLEPINSLFNKKSNKSSNLTGAENAPSS